MTYDEMIKAMIRSSFDATSILKDYTFFFHIQ